MNTITCWNCGKNFRVVICGSDAECPRCNTRHEFIADAIAPGLSGYRVWRAITPDGAHLTAPKNLQAG